MSLKKDFKKYSLNTYARVGPVFVKGSGSWLWDGKGNKYLDLFPGWGVSILGHAHPAIAKVIAAQAKKLIHIPNNLYFKEQAALAKEIVLASFPSRVFFGNSGAEAVEGAIKISRLYSKEKYEVITMTDSFHGRTFAAMSATGQKKYKAKFKPILKGFKEVAFGDLAAFKKSLSKKTAAVILELIQGEGGVNVASRAYIKEIKKICQKKKILLIFDEVQTGMGRTGKLFCFQHYGVKPDIMLLSKGLGAGVPISAIVVSNKIAGLMQPGLHASTFGGSPLVTSASLAAFKVIKKEKLLNNVNRIGDYAVKRLKVLKNKFSLIEQIKGKGLMLGIELNCPAQPIFLKCLSKKLIINATHGNILRFMPALNVSRKEIDKGLDILEGVLSNS